MIDLDQLETIRRQAFVDAIYLSRQKPVVSIFGRVPWEIIESFGGQAVRAYGIDYYVVEDEDLSLCSMLNSTLEYKRLDKCPFMAVSSLFIVDSFCPLRQRVIEEHFNPSYVYQDVEGLIHYLEDFFNQSFDPDRFDKIVDRSAQISNLLVQLRQSDLNPAIINQLTYYQQFIFDLEERLKFLEDIIEDINPSKKDSNPAYVGQLAGIDQHFEDQIMIAGLFCEEDYHIQTSARSFDFIKEKYHAPDGPSQPHDNVNRCQKYKKSYLTYEGES